MGIEIEGLVVGAVAPEGDDDTEGDFIPFTRLTTREMNQSLRLTVRYLFFARANQSFVTRSILYSCPSISPPTTSSHHASFTIHTARQWAVLELDVPRGLLQFP